MAETTPKIRILKGAESDLSAATYQIHDESHTIGNALRWMIMKNPKVEFCGYRYVCFSYATSLRSGLLSLLPFATQGMLGRLLDKSVMAGNGAKCLRSDRLSPSASCFPHSCLAFDR
ncbi:hypothetical protein AcW1_009300 [Taiwanofungus camphoratus]|nr:hypothetical protein AcW1_009300 [Antrodia cinnamomea]